ncbi:uncharacterized protein CCR75_007273 [Bremia lactucae]|uniref:Protein kinase domain-containing protein n=1 Tax=Bremia lactucae TaxID=4779 RepID=A0A976IAY1_BRELC|nr:hypothetical protein CCR75_007273 [Bremia lactucae]
MLETQVVRPISGTSMTTPSRETTLVLYSLVGEDIEPVQESSAQHEPDTNWNAFVLPLPPAINRVRLADVLAAFPLGSNFHFSFLCEDGTYLDLTFPESTVPFCGRKLLARVTPLDEEPSVKYVRYEEPRKAVIPSRSARLNARKDRAESYGSSTMENFYRDEYVELESSTCESQDEELSARIELSPLRVKVRKDQAESDWNRGSYQSGEDEHQIVDDGNRRQKADCDDQYKRHEGVSSRQSSEWAEAGIDAHIYLRKQTEQAYDFAKKISIDDAKKGASETAKKAKKWGGSLLSTISATISNASANVSKQTSNIQVGSVTVQVVRILAEGATAQVLMVRSLATNENFALKRVLCQSEEVDIDVLMELQVFHSVKHLNIMPLVEFSDAPAQQGMEFFFLIPFFERGSLWDAIYAASQSSSPLWPFTQRAALHLFQGICSGVLALHRAGFCHRDIKPHNIMLSSSSSGEDFLAYIPVVTDFGSCAPIHAEVNSRQNSLKLQDEANCKSSAPYQAPELIESTVGIALDGQSDVWSLGCGFLKLASLNGRVSFPPEQGGVVRHRGTHFTAEFCDFIRDMLQTNPEERPSVLDALEFTVELLSDGK